MILNIYFIDNDIFLTLVYCFYLLHENLIGLITIFFYLASSLISKHTKNFSEAAILNEDTKDTQQESQPSTEVEKNVTEPVADEEDLQDEEDQLYVGIFMAFASLILFYFM